MEPCNVRKKSIRKYHYTSHYECQSIISIYMNLIISNNLLIFHRFIFQRDNNQKSEPLTMFIAWYFHFVIKILMKITIQTTI